MNVDLTITAAATAWGGPAHSLAEPDHRRWFLPELWREIGDEPVGLNPEEQAAFSIRRPRSVPLSLVAALRSAQKLLIEQDFDVQGRTVLISLCKTPVAVATQRLLDTLHREGQDFVDPNRLPMTLPTFIPSEVGRLIPGEVRAYALQPTLRGAQLAFRLASGALREGSVDQVIVVSAEEPVSEALVEGSSGDGSFQGATALLLRRPGLEGHPLKISHTRSRMQHTSALFEFAQEPMMLLPSVLNAAALCAADPNQSFTFGSVVENHWMHLG